jgi:phosphohistidine phosphatase SixA
MELFLLRHGHAIANAPTDSERPLSDQGRADVRSAISQIAKDLKKLDAVWVSPYVRAQQTWAEARSLLPIEPTVVEQEAVIPSGNPRAVIQLIAAAKLESLLIVTHQPFVGDLLDYLCGFESGRYFLGTAHVVAVDLPEVEAGLGELRWHKKPIH